ncbi:MAG: hypothetical protein ABSE56_04060 [Bryobacteraceae bacterium]
MAGDFAKKQPDAEQKNQGLGTNIMYFVLQAQADLASAESELLDERRVAIK